jgi:outer membrane protein OmpA-like peptidoglycan-associated protein
MPKKLPSAAALTLAGVAAFSLAACGSTDTPPPTLTAAQAAYSSAANDPAVARQAALELQQAQQSLARAEQLWRSDAGREDVDHAAYLAERRAEIAEQTARLKSAQQQVRHADATRTQALLGARTAEAQQAQQQAKQAQQQAQQAENRADQLQQQLDKLESSPADTGPVLLTLGGIMFDVDSANLKPGAYRTIDRIATFLKEHPRRTVTIGGYTDATGSAAYNEQLSRSRADSVRAALMQDGVAPARIVARGYGESAPVATNDTAAGRQLNRRVEVAISGPHGEAPQQGSGSSSPRT